MKIIIQITICLFLTVSAVSGGMPPVKVQVSKVSETLSAEYVPAQGVLYFDTVTRVSSEISGLVKHIHFSKGDRIGAGDVLVALNTDFIEKDIYMKKKEIQIADIQIEHTRKNLERYEKLFEKDAASQTDYEDLSYAYQELITRKQRLEVALGKIRLKKAKSVIRAPFDGIIMEKQLDLGAWINCGTVICEIGAQRELFANVPINEKLLKFVATGSAMDLVINAYDKQVTGTVEGILPLADEKTKNVSLKVHLPVMNMCVANMSVTAYVPTSQPRKVKLVPRDAVVQIGGRHFIFTIDARKAKRMPLSILYYKDNYICSDTDALFPGMVVVVDGNQRLREDQEVRIMGDPS